MAAETAPPADLRAGLAGAAIAVSAWSAGTIIVKAIDMGGLAVAVYRFWMFTLLIVVYMEVRGTPMRWRALRHSLLGGIALGVDVALFFSAVKLTNVVNATLIGSLQPILVGVVAARFFGEEIRSRDAAWSLVALAGVTGVILASNGTPEWSASGDLLAGGAMVAWSAYFIFSKESKKLLTSTEYTAGTAFWAALINTPLALIFGQDLGLPSSRDFALLVFIVLVAGAVGHLLMNWSLVRIPLWIGSTFTLLIPVVASLLAWLALGEALTAAQVGAMLLVILALGMIVRGQSWRPAAIGQPV